MYCNYSRGSCGAAKLGLHCLNNVSDGLGAGESVDILDFDVEHGLDLAHDLDALDAVNAKLALEVHIHLGHPSIISGLVSENAKNCRLCLGEASSIDSHWCRRATRT